MLLLDYEVCDSFQGFLYGVYWQKNQDNTALSSKLEKIDKERRLATIEDFPYLAYEYKQHDPMSLWLAWFKKLASPTRLEMYQEALDVLGIDESQLTYDHIQQMNLSWKQFHDPTIIHELPSGCVALVDEVQNIWGARQSSKEVPPDVEHVATHRHNGQDLVYISQDFKDVDQFIRRRLQEYRHYHLIGGDNLHEYFHIRAFDPDKASDLEKTDKRNITRDSNYYGVYLSSIKHTQNVKTDPTIALGRKMIVSSISWIIACLLILVGVSITCFSQVTMRKLKNKPTLKQPKPQRSKPRHKHLYTPTTATTSASSTNVSIPCPLAPHSMTTLRAAQPNTHNWFALSRATIVIVLLSKAPTTP